MKNIRTWIISLMAIVLMSACGEIEIKIEGDAGININEEHTYKVVQIDTDVIPDSYKWEVVSTNSEYTLTNNTSNEVIFSATKGGKYLIKVIANKDGKTTSAELEIIVNDVLIIDGYILPLIPDKAVNDSTLLGIDSNNNSVRDDVEIYIYERFADGVNYKIDRAIAMQYAAATQVILIEPNKAFINKTYIAMDNAQDCKWYYYNKHLINVTNYLEGAKYRQKHKIFDAELKDVLFNTKSRFEAYMKFNDSLSGHVFDSTSNTKDKCDEDIDALGIE